MALNPSLCSRATLDQLLLAIDRMSPSAQLSFTADEWLKKARSEATPKLRTREEVDAEMVALMRERCGRESRSRTEDSELWARFQQLCSEPTAPDPTEIGACPPECPECEAGVPSVGPAPNERPCSCEESEGLRRRISKARVRVLASSEHIPANLVQLLLGILDGEA